MTNSCLLCPRFPSSRIEKEVFKRLSKVTDAVVIATLSDLLKKILPQFFNQSEAKPKSHLVGTIFPAL